MRRIILIGLIAFSLSGMTSCKKLILEDRRKCVMDFHLELVAPYPQDVKDHDPVLLGELEAGEP